MKIGILSDSHGRAAITAKAATLLAARGAELLIHLGDICDGSVIDALLVALGSDGKPRPPVRIVFGNCDADGPSLRRYAEALGVTVDDPAGEIVVDGRRVAFTHGHLHDAMRSATDRGVDYLLHGHTHVIRDDRVGSTRVVNPGALFRATAHTAALLDTATDQLEIVKV